MQRCGHCRKVIPSIQRCSGCSAVYYCNYGCQKGHWPVHKPECMRYRKCVEVRNRFLSLGQTLVDTGLLKTLCAIKEYAISESVGGFNCFTFTPCDDASEETVKMREALEVGRDDPLYTITPTTEASSRCLSSDRISVALLLDGFHVGDIMDDHYRLSSKEASDVVMEIFGTPERTKAYLSPEDNTCYVVCVPSRHELHVITA